MPIDRRQSKEQIIKELIHKYKTTGKIGNTSPRDLKHATEIANAVAYSSKKNEISSDFIKDYHKFYDKQAAQNINSQIRCRDCGNINKKGHRLNCEECGSENLEYVKPESKPILGRIKNLAKKIMGEEWVGSIKSTWHQEPILVDVFKNPSKHEILKMTKGGKDPVRFFVDLNGDFYVWSFGDAMHDEVAQQLKLQYRVKGTYYNPEYIEFFKVKTPERVYPEIENSKLMNVLDKDFHDNLLRKKLVNN